MGDGFIQDFQQKIGELSGLHQQLSQNIQQKNGFLRDVSGKLGGISERLNRLADRIGELKAELDNLRAQMGSNTNDIQASQEQIQQLTQENQALKATIEQLTQQQQQSQQEIEQCRQEREQLTAENQRLTLANQELQARIEVLDRNPTQQAMDEQIRQAIEPFTQQLEENRQTMEQNRQRMTEMEQQIQQLTEERDVLRAQLDGQGADLNNNRGVVAELQQQIQQLGQQNAQMRELITQATGVIDEAKVSIQAVLENPEFNDTGAINGLIKNIEDTIIRIEQIVGGNSQIRGNDGQVWPPVPPGTPPGQLPSTRGRLLPGQQPPLPPGPPPFTRNPITGQNNYLISQNDSRELLGAPPNFGEPQEERRLGVSAKNIPASYESNVVIRGAGIKLKDLIAKLTTIMKQPVKSKDSDYYSQVIKTLRGFVQNENPISDVYEYIQTLVREDNSIFRNFNRNGREISGGKRKTRKLNKKTKRRQTRKTRKTRKNRKTRKLRIYRGGFIYGATTKRPSLAATLKSSTSSSSRLSKNKNKNKNAIY